MIRSTITAMKTAETARPWRMFSTGAGSGDSFSKRESAYEDKYVHDHDAELISKLRKDLAKKTTEQAAAAAALEAAIEAAPKVSPVDVPYGSAGVSGQSAFSKKEAAAEEKYFREQDKEKLEKLRHKQ